MTKEILLSTFKDFCVKLVSDYISNASKGKKSGGGLLDALGGLGGKLGGLSALGGDSGNLLKQMTKKAEELIGQSSGIKKDDVWDDMMKIAKSSLKDAIK